MVGMLCHWLGARSLRSPGETRLLYEYFWERNYPQTPTMHAVLSGRWKYIRYHGIWDTDELFDLEADPAESTNLIARPEHQETVARMHQTLFELLDEI